MFRKRKCLTSVFHDASGLWRGHYKTTLETIPILERHKSKILKSPFLKILQPNFKGHQHDLQPMFRRMDGEMAVLLFH